MEFSMQEILTKASISYAILQKFLSCPFLSKGYCFNQQCMSSHATFFHLGTLNLIFLPRQSSKTRSNICFHSFYDMGKGISLLTSQRLFWVIYLLMACDYEVKYCWDPIWCTRHQVNHSCFPETTETSSQHIDTEMNHHSESIGAVKGKWL